ncbi:solute carrier family protein [Aureococcus anophagefferens]|uniref:Solute carrier family protein n=1 Tax=Aureococcus anophagefferens TaxID=44056 RepID=A0ABR1GDZ7_AURAN
MMQRRQREAEHRLKTKKYRRRGSTNLAHLYERCSQSKLMSMVANLVGAIGCILGNKHIMSTHARMPLTLTFLGYGFVILYFVVANRLRPGRRPRAQVDVESGERNRAGPSRRQVVTLASLLFNSVGFTQLSKVLTTPLIAIIETSRGSAAPLNVPRIVCLVLIHAGVFVASVSDVTLNRIGCFVAIRAAIESQSSASIRTLAATRGARAATRRRPDGRREARDEQAAVRELVEATLPAAALALLPAMAYFEGGVLLNCWRTMDAAAYARLGVVAVLGAWTSSTGYMVIGRLSALTHQILGQFKMCCLLFGSYAFLGADLNGRQLSGASLTMAAVLLYTRATIKQRAAPPPKAKRREEDAPLLADDDDRGAGLSPARIRRASSLRRSKPFVA